MAESQSQPSHAQLRAIAYQQHPNVFNGLRHTLSELQSIARIFANQQQYDVTLNAITAISSLLAEYLRVRDGDLVMPSSLEAIVGPTDFQFDTVLTEALEGVTATFKAAIVRGDVQLSSQIIDSLQNLAVQSVNTKTLFAPPGENPTTAFIRAYLFGPVQEGAIRGLDDVAMHGARAQSEIGKALLKKNLYLTVQTTISDIEKLAYISITQRKWHVTGAPVRAIAGLLMAATSQPLYGSYTVHAALRALQGICEAELQYKTAPMDSSLRFALGPYLDITEPTSLPHTEVLLIEKLTSAIKDKNWEEVSLYRNAFEELNEDLWQHFVAIGVAAAKTESFALFWINTNIGEIARQFLWLHAFLGRSKPEATDEDSARQRWMLERFTQDLENTLHWIVGATYWRIFDAFIPPIKTNLVWDFFPTLSDIGIRAVEANVPSLAESAIDSIKSIALKCLGKPISSRRSAPRVAAYIARIGIIAQQTGQEEVLSASVKAIKEFDQRYLANQRELQPTAESYDTVLNEISGLARDLSSRAPLIDPEDATFFRRVTPEDIESFVKLFQKDLPR